MFAYDNLMPVMSFTNFNFLFVSQADPKFQEFLGEFIRLWESQLDLIWDVKNEFISMSEEGPHLSLLPDEFLPSLDRYLYQLKTVIENVSHFNYSNIRLVCSSNYFSLLKDVNAKNVDAFTKTVKALVIVSRNLDNIPFIASCQLIPSCISISSTILTIMKTGKQLERDEVTPIVLVCLFLEALYDPYFSYRKSIVNQTVDTSKIKYQPALLQAEVIPFIYGKLQPTTGCFSIIKNVFFLLRLLSTSKC